MSETNQEPTMEEILASIRRIISEDDQPQPAAEAEPAAAEPATADEEVLELTDRVEEPAPEPEPMETVGDLDVFPRDEPQPEPVMEQAPPSPPEPVPAPVAAPARSPAVDDEGLLSRTSAESAAASFAQLSQTLTMPTEARSLEDVVRELLKPMLRDWLDQNLPAIVERTVREEVERVSRAGKR